MAAEETKSGRNAGKAPTAGGTDAAPAEARPGSVVSMAARLVRDRRGWQRIALVLTAGGISTLAHAPYFAWPVLFLTFPILYWAIEGSAATAAPLRSSAASGFVFAFAYFFFGLSWVGEAFLVEAEIFAWLKPFAITLLPTGMGLYWAIAAALTCWAWSRIPVCGANTVTGAAARVLVLAVAFSLLEWVRGHAFTGLPWHNPGLALTAPLELMQATALVGMYGLIPFAFAITLAPAAALSAAGTREAPKALAAIALLTLLPLALAYAYGASRLAIPPSPPVEGVRLRIVQPSIPQRDKWRADKQAEIFAAHLDLSRRDGSGRIDGLAGITHVIWPEASMPFGPLDNQDALDSIGHLLPDGAHLIAGILRRGDPQRQPVPVHNSLAALDHTGRLTALYDKIHLVPFGEYLPFPAILESIGLQNLVRQRGGFTPGPTPKPLMTVDGLPPFAPIICYEAIFPEEVVQGSKRPGLLLIVTNDGWFGRSIGPSQHFHQARVRAVEQGLPVVRSANNGISAMIDPDGRVVASLDLDARGAIDVSLPGPRPWTWVSRFDGLGIALGFALALALLSLTVLGCQWIHDRPAKSY